VSTTSSVYREHVLILHDLLQSYGSSLSSSSQSSNNSLLKCQQQAQAFDDFLPFDLNLSMISLNQMQQQQPQQPQPTGDDNSFHKKIKLLEDLNYIKEYRNLINTSGGNSSGGGALTSGLIPSELSRIVKAYSEAASSYDTTCGGAKKLKKDDLIALVQSQIAKVTDQIEASKSQLTTVCLRRVYLP
jgi:hypothetical protein